MPYKASKSTIKDVAQACGVSLMTVSHVINNKPGKASAETRARVLKAVQELDYQPSAIARGLTRRKMNAIGVVFYTHSTTPLVSASYFGDMLGGILETAMQARQSTTLFTEISCLNTRENLATYCDGRCDGLIFVGPPSSDALAHALRRKHTPYVFLGDQTEDPGASCVDVDNLTASRQAVAFLLENGHRRIAFLGGDRQMSSTHLREKGYRQALSAAGLEIEEALILPGYYSSDSGHERIRDLMQQAEHPPTALFCASDEIASGAMNALSEMGLRVPEDVSIAGFDDSRAAVAVQPVLTTMRQPFQELARRAVELLLAQIQGSEEAGAKILMPASLIVRRSISAPSPGFLSTLTSLNSRVQKGLHP